MTNRHCKQLPLLVLLLCAFFLAPQGKAEEALMPSMAEILASGTLRVGVAVYPPWTIRGKNGDLSGFEVDVARQLADDMNVTAQLSIHAWDELVPALAAGEIDIVIAGLSITPDRALLVNFSRPYASSGIGIATNTRLTGDFESLLDLDDPGVTIGAVRGTISERVARRMFGRAKMRQFANSTEAARELGAGRLHALVAANPVPRFVSLQFPEAVDEPVESPLLLTREAFAVRKGDADFLAFLNAWIVARDADTWLPTHHNYWFRSLRWQHANEQDD